MEDKKLVLYKRFITDKCDYSNYFGKNIYTNSFIFIRDKGEIFEGFLDEKKKQKSLPNFSDIKSGLETIVENTKDNFEISKKQIEKMINLIKLSNSEFVKLNNFLSFLDIDEKSRKITELKSNVSVPKFKGIYTRKYLQTCLEILYFNNKEAECVVSNFSYWKYDKEFYGVLIQDKSNTTTCVLAGCDIHKIEDYKIEEI